MVVCLLSTCFIPHFQIILILEGQIIRVLFISCKMLLHRDTTVFPILGAREIRHLQLVASANRTASSWYLRSSYGRISSFLRSILACGSSGISHFLSSIVMDSVSSREKPKDCTNLTLGIE